VAGVKLEQFKHLSRVIRRASELELTGVIDQQDSTGHCGQDFDAVVRDKIECLKGIKVCDYPANQVEQGG
jgi:hypothetical protein